MTVAQANTVAATTTDPVTATITDGDMATLAGLNETGNAYTITITDKTVDSTALNELDAKTTVAVNASAVTILTGTAAAANTAYSANTAGTITD